jgi:hypothetical protein
LFWHQIWFEPNAAAGKQTMPRHIRMGSGAVTIGSRDKPSVSELGALFVVFVEVASSIAFRLAPSCVAKDVNPSLTHVREHLPSLVRRRCSLRLLARPSHIYLVS